MLRKLSLTTAVATMMLATPLLVSAAIITSSLDLGMSGGDVTSLQTFLAADATLYPSGLVTGYFGQLTKAGVERFQTRNGIISSGTPATTGYGRVGPATRAAINAQMNGNAGADIYAPIISSINVTSNTNNVVLRWNTNENAAGIVYYSTSYPSIVETSNDATISGSVAMTDTLLRTSQVVTIQGLSQNTTYYYVVYTRDGTGNVQMTWPATFRTQ